MKNKNQDPSKELKKLQSKLSHKDIVSIESYIFDTKSELQKVSVNKPGLHINLNNNITCLPSDAIDCLINSMRIGLYKAKIKSLVK
ncbi:MAG: hypothetical protein RSE41_07560 [Clostridia bacterium]